MTYFDSELRGRLACAAAFLVAASGIDMSPAFTGYSASVLARPWLAPSPATSIVGARREEEEAPFHTTIALREIATAKAILSELDALAGDLAFAAYMSELEVAVSEVEKSNYRAPDLQRFAGRLRSARDEIQNRVGSVVGWLAVTKCIDGDTGPVEIPARFYSVDSVTIGCEEVPTADDIALAFEFDDIAAGLA